MAKSRLSKFTICRALLQKGYFPKELPPVFTTEDFGKHFHDILEEWSIKKIFEVVKRKNDYRRNSYSYKLIPTDAEIISMPKRGFERRNLHITHPVPQALLAKEIAENWPVVSKWLSRQIFSEAKIRVGASYGRAIEELNFSLHFDKKRFLEANSDWVVTTDITRFYPSIYTHSIAWAAYGKDRVKSSLKLYRGSLADRLDLLVRSCNRNQTIGIPIGPDTSRIIAEVISSRIDCELRKKCPDIKSIDVDRLQDDWSVGVSTLEDAEKVLSHISTVYRSFGLEINGSKTSIDRIIAGQRADWISEIGSLLSYGKQPLTGAKLQNFLNNCLRLQSENSTEPVINYALSVMEGRRLGMGTADVVAIESFALKAVVVAPFSADRICQLLLDFQYRTRGRIYSGRISERFTNLIKMSLEKGHHFEVIWLLYTLRGLKKPIRVGEFKNSIEEISSSAIALILLDMKSKGLIVGKLPVKFWEERITKDSILQDESWLLAYEGFRHGWLTDRKGLMGKQLFKPMADRNLVFYNPRRNISKSATNVKLRRQRQQRQKHELRRLQQKVWRHIPVIDY